MSPDLSRVAEERIGSFRVAKVDMDQHPEIALDLRQPSWKTVPLLILYKNGIEVARRGSTSFGELASWLAEHGL